jgi:hypothetical protein
VAEHISWTDTFTVPVDDSDGLVGVKVEDGGQAMIMYAPARQDWKDEDSGFWVQLHSWEEDLEIPDADQHKLFRSLMGRRIKVTIETVDD